MKAESRKDLYEIKVAASEIGRYTLGKTLADYVAETMLQAAVAWQFTQIGEALRRVARDDEATAGQITNVRKIIAFRNLLVHAYEKVEHPEVWGFVQLDLPVLRQEVEELLDRYNADTSR